MLNVLIIYAEFSIYGQNGRHLCPRIKMNAQLSPLMLNFEHQRSTRWALMFGHEHYVQT